MNWLQTQITMLDAATGIIGFGVNWLLQSTLLLAVGLVVGRLLKQRGSAVQSVLYRTTLVAVLVCPMATWILSVAGVSGWSVEIPEAWTYQQADTAVADADPLVIEPAVALPVFDSATRAEPAIATNELSFAGAPLPSAPPLVSIAPNGEVLTAPIEPTEPAVTTPVETYVFTVGRFAVAAAGGAVLWILISAGLLWRLGTAWRRLARLRRQTTRAEPTTLRICHELAGELTVPAPDVRQSPFLPSPCLAGLRRPAVLLPDVELSLPIRDVLIHELAHLLRRDCHWDLLRRLASAVFFFQPLLWRLSRCLELTAEEVCDDYVVHYGGDREAYAHRLVDIAELSSAPVAAAGLGIVSLRSMLAKRVTRIMDTSRSLSTRVGSLLLALVLAGGLVGTSIVGLVGVGPQASQADVESGTNDEQTATRQEKDDDQYATDGDDDLITVRGKVVDPGGKLVAGAEVYVLRWVWDFGEKKPLAVSKTDGNGSFEISYRKSQYFENSGRPEQWREADIAVFADGYGPGWVAYKDIPHGEEPTIRLVKDDVPIIGRVVDLEGKPVVGVTVEVGGLNASVEENLDDWIEGVRAGKSVASAWRLLGNSLPLFSAARWKDVTTDPQGRFRLTGIGRERVVWLHLSGSTIATKTIAVATRRMEPIEHPSYDFPGAHSTTNYGAEFEFTAAPSRNIEGVIRDAKTGEPIVGVEVWSDKFAGENIHGIHTIKTKTDASGRYRLEGMPKGDGNEIVVVPVDLPYFTSEYEVPNPSGMEPIQLDVELNRGIWVTGRVIDAQTGRPIGARMHYAPFHDNTFAHNTPEVASGDHYQIQSRFNTKSDGRYRMVVLPGRGIACVNCIQEAYPSGQGFNEIAGIENLEAMERFAGPLTPSKKWPTAVKEINPAEGEREVVCDFSLDPGGRVTIKAVDATGKPLIGTEVSGWRETHGGFRRVETALVELVAFRKDEHRTVLLRHKDRRLGRGLRVKPTDGKDGPFEVQLLPCARVVGRLIDDNEEPVRGVALRINVSDDGDYGRTLPGVSTDSDGRFSHDGFLPGLSYSILAEGARIEFAVVAKDLAVKPGDTIDLGTIDVTSDERPEPVRTKAAESDNANATSAESTEDRAAANETSGQKIASHEFEGKVVGPTGQPVDGAELYLVFHIPQPTGLLIPTWKPVATTDAGGAFRCKVNARDFGVHATVREFGYGSLVAVKEGYGFAWSHAGKYETSGMWLRDARARLNEAPAEFLEQLKRMLSGAGEPLKLVVDDEPIRGQVVDIDGQPVAGARLTLLEVSTGFGDDLTEWHKVAREPKADYYSARMKMSMSINGPQVRSLAKPAVTDDGGRFTLHGVGRGRITRLLIDGPGIESAKIYARTETGEKIELLRERRSPDMGSYIYHAAELTHVAGPSTAIIGIVRDGETKAPLAGVTVKSQSRHGERISGWGQDFVRAVTDGEGKYRLEGMPIGRDNRLAAIAPTGDVAYLSMSKRAATVSQESPIEIDFELRRGVWIEGRITDKQTGKGLSGRLAYYAKEGSPNYEFAPSLRVDQRDRLQSDDDGYFRMAVLPGAGFITFMAHEHQKYPRTETILGSDGSRQKIEVTMLKTGPSMLMPQNYHLVAEINPAANAERVKLNLQLDRGTSVFGRVVDSNGEPVTGFYYSGQMARFGGWKPSAGDKFELRGYDRASPRNIYLAHSKRNLAAHVVVKGEPPDDFVVKLQPAGKVKGRLVDEDGAPLANCQLVPWHPSIRSPADPRRAHHAPPLPRNVAHSQSGQYETDEDGRFEISCLAPGVKYRLRAFDRASMTPARGRMPKFSGPLDAIIEVAPGDSIDLGDVRLTDEAESTGASKHPKKESPAQAVVTRQTALAGVTSDAPSPPVPQPSVASLPPGRQAHVIHGRVTGAEGQPIAGVHIAAIGMKTEASRGGDLGPRGHVLAEGTTDENGQYSLTLKGASSKTHRYANVIARKHGSAIVWQKLNLDVNDTEVSLKLRPEEPIRGRLVDIEGQPAAGARMVIQGLMKRSIIGLPSSGVGYRGGESIPAAWLQPFSSDDEGRFTIRDIPAGHGVLLKVEGNERVAPQDVALNTGMPEQRGERDGTYRPLVRNVKAGEEAIVPLSPAQLFEGVVTYEDTGEPAPHARLTIWASQQAEFGSMVSVPGKADADGRYRISPNPGVGFGVTAYPPDGVAYLARQTPSSAAIRWKTGDRVRQVDMTLPRGVLVRGKVTESGTDAPVAGASIQYVPEEANNPHTADDILTGWQAIQLSNERGEFEIAVLPGPGRLLVHGPQGKYVLQEIAGRLLSRGESGGRRNYVHAVHEIDPEEGADPINVELRLQPGRTMAGRVVDKQGDPAKEVLVISRLSISPYSLYWRGHTPPTLGGRFELSGLDAKSVYPVYFLDAKRRLGTTAMIRADSAEPTVVLKPCGNATARYVDPDGNPHVGFEPGLDMVVTPGAHPSDWEAAKRGEIAADTDFVSNIDRTNYWTGPKTDDEGRIRFPALIPGATYRMTAFEDGNPKILKEFQVQSNETLDLDDVVIDLDK